MGGGRVRTSWCELSLYLDGADEREDQRDQDDPFLKSSHDASKGCLEKLGRSSSIKAFNWAGRGQPAGRTLIYSRLRHK